MFLRVRGVVVAVAGGLLLAGCGAVDGPAEIAVSASACGVGWSARGGAQTFLVRNVGTGAVEVDLVDPASGGVYAEVAALGPGTVRALRVELGDGQYAWRCVPDDADPVTGPTVRVSGAGGGGAKAVLPVTYQDLRPAVAGYRAYVATGIAALARDVAALETAARTGDLARTRAAWLTAHLAYERLGAAYDTFGDVGDAIDGTPDGLPGGTDDPGFTGLRRIEYGLWHGAAPRSLLPLARRLRADVDGLRRDFPDEETDPRDLPLRAHEIMEDAVTFELTGRADQGSGTGLATVDADLDGTEHVLDALAPVLARRYPDWARTTAWLRRTRTLVEAQRDPAGRWTPLSALDTETRQRVNGAVSQLVELLAPIAAIGETRRTS
jgi:iron uptake system component EfeO